MSLNVENGEADKANVREDSVDSPGLFACPDQSGSIKTIFIWNLDEDTFKYGQKNSGMNGKETLENILKDIVRNFWENEFHSPDFTMFNQTHINDISLDDMYISSSLSNQCGANIDSWEQLVLLEEQNIHENLELVKKLALRNRKMKEIYTSCKYDPSLLMSTELSKTWVHTLKELDLYHYNWYTQLVNALKLIGERSSSLNILVSSESVDWTLCQLLVYNMAMYFDAEYVFNDTKIGRYGCYDAIMNYLGRQNIFVVLGDSQKTRKVSKKMNLPYWKVTEHEDLLNLQKALHMKYL